MKSIYMTMAVVLTMGLAAQAGQELKADASASTLKWTAEKVTGSHYGAVQLKSGSLMIENGQISDGNFTIDMTTIDTQDIGGGMKKRLDGHLKSDDFFSADKHPNVTFDITKVEKLAKPGEKGENIQITGDLTIKGITNSITFPAKSVVKGSSATADAKIIIDRTKFDIKYKSPSFFDIGDKAIYDDFTIEVHLVAKQ